MQLSEVLRLVMVWRGVRRKSHSDSKFGKCSSYHISNKSVLSTTFTGSAVAEYDRASVDAQPAQVSLNI